MTSPISAQSDDDLPIFFDPDNPDDFMDIGGGDDDSNNFLAPIPNGYDVIFGNTAEISNGTINESEDAVLHNLISHDFNNALHEGDTSGSIFSVSEHDIKAFMQENNIGERHLSGLKTLINTKKKKSVDDFLNMSDADALNVLREHTQRYGSDILTDESGAEIEGFLSKWEVSEDKKQQVRTLIGKAKRIAPVNESEKALLEATGRFNGDGVVHDGDIYSPEMRDYLIKKLTLEPDKYPLHQKYLDNVVNFIAARVSKLGTMSLNMFIAIFSGDDGIIDANSIEESAKSSGYVSPETEVGLRHPEFITDPIHQKNMGNCWFLSGFGAFNNSTEGRALISRSIAKNDDGSYTVNFPGYPEHTYTISAEEVASAHSSMTAVSKKNNEHVPIGTDGSVVAYVSDPHFDKVLIALNLAAEKLIRDTDWRGVRGDTDGLVGGWAAQVAQLLGKTVDELSTDDANESKIKEYLTNNPIDPNMTIIAKPKQETGDIEHTNNGNTHLFYVKSYDADTDTITYINPWDSRKERTISFDEFMQYSDEVEIMHTE